MANSSIIVLSARPYSDALTACKALGEQLWSPDIGNASIQHNLDYLKYKDTALGTSSFWIASKGVGSRAIDRTGRISWPAIASRLPVLCTQSAPFSNETFKDTSEQWQVTVRSNGEYLTGYIDFYSFSMRKFC